MKLAFAVHDFNPWAMRINAKSRPAVRRGRLCIRNNDEHEAAARIVELSCRQAVIRSRVSFPRGPVTLTVVFRGKRRSSKHGPCECMGDIDAPLKALQDALTKGGAWSDDTQVVEVRATKRLDARAGIDVEVRAAGGGS